MTTKIPLIEEWSVHIQGSELHLCRAFIVVHVSDKRDHCTHKGDVSCKTFVDLARIPRQLTGNCHGVFPLLGKIDSLIIHQVKLDGIDTFLAVVGCLLIFIRPTNCSIHKSPTVNLGS